LPKCGACKLNKDCRSPYMPVYGNGKKKILLVGEVPSEADDEKGRPFAGDSGSRLREELDRLGVDLKEDCWSTNALICHSPHFKKIARNVEFCRPNLLKVIHEKRPRVIILLGTMAIQSLIKWLWKESAGELGPWLGWVIPSQQINAWVCPTFHPSYVEREKNQMAGWWFRDHLKAAVKKASSRPWDVVPDYSSMVDIITDTDEAAERIHEITKLKERTAADYEGNGLKTEYDGFKILSCSLSVLGSNKAISFPFHGKAIKALGEFWQSKCPKIASNMKFEDRLTKWYYGFYPRNWYLDIMLMAHFLNCRPRITSLKFQIFVRRGVGAYDDKIESLLRSAEGRRLNDAEFTIEKRQLLQYGGEDSLYEGFVAEDQLEELKLR
jgi:uracil-DNA glycosylase family 4